MHSADHWRSVHSCRVDNRHLKTLVSVPATTKQMTTHTTTSRLIFCSSLWLPWCKVIGWLAFAEFVQVVDRKAGKFLFKSRRPAYFQSSNFFCFAQAKVDAHCGLAAKTIAAIHISQIGLSIRRQPDLRANCQAV